MEANEKENRLAKPSIFGVLKGFDSVFCSANL